MSVTGFAAEWLRLREPFDAAARSQVLAARFGAALASNSPRRIVDLAAGSGAGFRALAPLIGGDQDWLLVDSDPALLALQPDEIARWSQRAGWHCRSVGADVTVSTGSSEWRARAVRLDLAQYVEQLDIADAGVTTSAFLDLVSASWLGRLSVLIARHARPFLATLTVDGRREWHPSLPADARIARAFARDQENDKGFGPALGSRAPGYLAQQLAGESYTVSTARSDWQVGAEHPEMLLRMAQESAAIARKVEPALAAQCLEWLALRTRQIASGSLTLCVGHLDLLAIPPTGTARPHR